MGRPSLPFKERNGPALYRRGRGRPEEVDPVYWMAMIKKKDEERFWKKVDRTTTPDGCYPWTGYLDRDRYGRIKVNGRMRQATHIALELAGWIIPFEWLEVMHTCDNTSCVRPDHLRIVPHTENIEDRDRKGRQASGEHNGRAKLRQQDVDEIRRLAGGISQRALGRRFGIDHKAVRKILRGETWQHAA